MSSCIAVIIVLLTNEKFNTFDLSKFSKVNMATGMLTCQSSKKIIVQGSEAQNLSARRKKIE